MNKALEVIRNTIRNKIALLARVINSLSKGKITPNMITITGLVAHFYISWIIAKQHFVWGAIMLMFFGLFDTLDGSLARIQKNTSKKGMLLDSVTDRLKEVLIYCGIAYYFISSNIYTAYAVWAVLACGMSVIVSYINAWGEVVIKKSQKNSNHTTNKSFRTGIMSFDIRMVAIIIGLLSGYPHYLVIFITITASITALQRFNLIVKNL